MGLDTVELVMEFEDEFGISIPDADAEKIITVGDSVEFIISELHKKPDRPPIDTCSSARIFRRLRAGLQATFDVPRGAVRPSVAIGDVIPSGRARARWSQFAREHDLPKPPWSIFGEKRFPKAGTTISDLVRRVRHASFYTARGDVDRVKVLQKVREIVSEQLGIEFDEIQPHKRYIDDLNCG